MMFIDGEPRDWGEGIPEYNESDLMTIDELYDFALDVVLEYETEYGAEVVDVCPSWEYVPSIVFKINGELSFVLVEATVAPDMPKLSDQRKQLLFNQAKKFNAKCYYAPVGFGACDPERFAKSLALRGDGFYANYEGMENLQKSLQRNNSQVDSKKNNILKKYLEILCRCYSIGRFEALFPLLADECVLESQWVLIPNTGKAAVMDYLNRKGTNLREHDCYPVCTIVEFIGNMNTVKNADVQLNGVESQRMSVGLWYPDGKLAMYMRQTLNGQTNGAIVDLQLNSYGYISRIDLCMPELFNFKHFDGPF